jgi:N-methylhydantoinase B
MKFAARGVDSGLSGAPGHLALASGSRLASKGRHFIPPGDRVVIMSPGGGGIGDPKLRDRASIETDVANGLVSADAADTIYGMQPAKRAEKSFEEVQ